jgi:hypothetical protein
MVIKLFHETDPRYLMVHHLPERVTLDDLSKWKYGKPLTTFPGGYMVEYKQPDGHGTDWVRPPLSEV